MKLHSRLTLSFTAVTAVALLASFVTVYVLVKQDEIRDLDVALRAQADVVAHKPSIEGDARVPEKPAGATARYAALYDERGEPRTATHSFGDAHPPSLHTLGLDGPPDEDGTSVNLVVHGKKLRGVVIPTDRGPLLFAVSQQSVDEDQRFLARIFAALFALAMAATTLVARLLGRRVARDVSAIASVAQAVAAGDLTARVGADRAIGSDETTALAQDLDTMIAQLDALMSAQRTFVSHAAHELRSPLATLRGELQLALRRDRSAAEYRTAVQQALADVEELRQLTEDLLTLARVQKARDRTASFEVRALVSDALRMSRGHAESAHVKVVEPAGDEVLDREITGVQRDLARALRNLIDNAVAHSPAEGTVRVVARIVAGERPEVLEISVEDEGPGVDAADLERIFTPFWRGSSEESGAPGAGLGLAIAREIARQHGGDIELDRSHAGGARFVLRVPVTPPVTDAPRAPSRVAAAKPGRVGAGV